MKIQLTLMASNLGLQLDRATVEILAKYTADDTAREQALVRQIARFTALTGRSVFDSNQARILLLAADGKGSSYNNALMGLLHVTFPVGARISTPTLSAAIELCSTVAGCALASGDPFLQIAGVTNERDAMKMSLIAALQRNKTYRNGSFEEQRNSFRAQWTALIRAEAQAYVRLRSDAEHCEAIRRISNILTGRFGNCLVNGRIRFGTSQKAFNLYLKCLWCLGKIHPPPHCPIDAVVLNEAGISGSWTKCDSEEEYMGWVKALREKTQTSLSEWEYDVWLRFAFKQQSKPSAED